MGNGVPCLVVGGTTSGVGKTSIAVGLMAALRERGLVVQAFKVGPDFIDPMHHEAATGRPSINLDGWMLSKDQCLSAFHRHCADADIAIVEGVMGLFDGRDGTTEAGSTAQLAKWLGAPVLLVLDCSAVARSAAAIVKGYQAFDPALRLGALLFNKVGGAAHTRWLADAVESAGLGVPVLGGVPKDDAVAVQERYLGLHMPRDSTMPPNLIHNLAALVRNHVDLEEVLTLAQSATGPGSGSGGGGVENGEKGADLAGAKVEEAEAGLAPESPPPAAEAASPAMGPGLRTDTANSDEMEAAAGRPASAASSVASISMNNKKKKKRKAKARAAAAAASAATAVPAAPAKPANGRLETADNETATCATAPEESSDAAAGGGEAAARPCPPRLPLPPPPGPPVRIAVARDAAFCFYYNDNFALLESAGAELVFFSPLTDALPPGVAGVYLGGGYPERHAAELAENKLLRAGLAAFADAGGVIYAECGGLMFLSKSIQPRGDPPQPMVGVFPFKTVLPPGRYTMGYVEIEATAACPLFPAGARARGHVHHASELVEEHHVGGVVEGAGGAGGEGPWRMGYVTRPQVPGAPEAPEGFTRGNVLASYVHLHFGGCPELAGTLVEACRGVDVDAAAAAVAAAEAAAPMLEGAAAQVTPPGSSLRHPMAPGPLLAVRSSPDFHRGGRASQSVDLGRPLQPHMATGGHFLPSKVPSPATTLSKVVSSGSLSVHSLQHGAGGGYYGGHSHLQAAHLAALHAADRASLHSCESPSALSPRSATLGSDAGGSGYPGAYPHHHPHYPPYGSQFYHPTVPDHMTDPGSMPPGLVPYSLPPLGPATAAAAVRNNPLAQHAQHAYGGAQHPHYSPHHCIHQQMRYGSAPGSARSDEGSLPSSASWAQLRPSLSNGSLDLSAGVGPAPGNHYAKQQQAFQARQTVAAPPPPLLQPMHTAAPPEATPTLFGPPPGRFLNLELPDPLDLSAAATAAAAGSATPHNWQHHGFPASDKIATLGPGATEIAWAMGLGARVVAVADGADFPAEAATRARAVRRLAPAAPLAPALSAHGSASGSPSKPLSTAGGSVSTQGSSANLTALAAAAAAACGSATGAVAVDERVLARERPGLIIYEEEDEEDEDTVAVAKPASQEGGGGSPQASASATATRSRSAGALDRAVCDALAAAGLQFSCRVLALSRHTLADVLASMLAVGEAAGVGDQAARAVDRCRARLRRVATESARAASSSSSPYTSRPRVLVLRSLRPLAAEGRWAPDVIALAGGESGPVQPGDPLRPLTWQHVLEFAPEVLIIAGLRDGAAPRAFHDLCAAAALPGWWILPAVRSGAVFVCEEALLRRGGPRLVEGAEAVARMVHGDGVSVCCPPRAVLKLSLRPGQRCRPRLLPNYFMAYV